MRPELQSVFVEESQRLLEALRRGLASGEQLSRLLPELFRCAHTLKGNVKLAGFPEMELIVAPLTEGLRLAKQRGTMSREQASAVAEAVDACRALLEGRKVAGLPAVAARLRGATGASGAPGALRPRIKILLIEDSDLQAKLILGELARCDGGSFAVVERTDRLAQGLEQIARDGVDLVLLDLNLPDSQGIETFTRLSERSPAMPVVILTVADDDALAMDALHKGAQDYLVKGQIDTRVLPRIIRYAIERKRIEESLKKARGELELRVEERTSELRKANRELALFASAASHELQEPLRKIINWGDLLKRQCGPALGEAGLKLLGEMQQAARRQGDLIDSLRQLTRVTTKGRTLEPVELDAVIREILSDMSAALAQAGGRVEAGPLPTLRADRLQIRQLFQNLLSNAFKYRKKEEPPLVAIRSRARDGWAEISVQDNGIGFEQKYAERIFEPFQRLHGRGSYEGTGLGLAICARIVARHGGSISARGEPGKGATFTLTLPLAGPAR